MSYTHFRYIAYEVPTATYRTDRTGSVVCDYSPGGTVEAVARLPVPATTAMSEDAKKRLRRFAGVVDLAAKQLPRIGDNASTLKIFMAPEFYFRPVAVADTDYHSGTYPGQDRNAILRTMDEMFAHEDYYNWLFIPGTMLWNTREDPFRPHLYFNTLMHVQGGQKSALRLIEKNQPSRIDGMPMVIIDEKPVMDRFVPAYDKSYRVFHECWANRKQRVALVSGTPMGFEVCLDHLAAPSCRILKTVLRDWPVNEGRKQSVDLHLLCAGGMSINPSSVAARANGYILRNDGLANPGAHSELRQVVRSPLSVPPADIKSLAELGAPVVQVVAVPIPQGAMQVPSKGPDYSTFEQRIVFYPKLPMP